jgi:ribonuclease BN (tRNA processing enzyme)
MTGEPGDQSRSKIVLLGTGTPNAEPDRSGPSVAIVVDETPYLVDFGPGVVRRAAAAREAGIEALEVKNLTRAFVTHLHSDHTAGYPDLILTPWVLEREEPLEVYGPRGTRAMTEHVLAAYREDIEARLDGLEPINDQGYVVNVHEIEAGAVYQDSKVRVEAFPVSHGAIQAFGYKFYTPDETIVISGDTALCEGIVEASRRCDVLLHEVYSAVRLERRSPVWQRYHSAIHTSSYELAELALGAQPGLLILYHQLFWGASEEDLLSEITEHYDGQVVSGNDLEVY